MSGYFPSLPYIVIDQNRCRGKEYVESLFRRCKIEDLKLLLPDTAVYEFSKGTAPFLTWRRSLEHLCVEPEFVVAGRSIPEMMREEISTGQPIEDVVDHNVTPWLQRLLCELKTGDDTSVNAALSGVAKIIDAEKGIREQHASNKKIVSKFADHWKKNLDGETLRKLRNQEKEGIAEILSEPSTAFIVYQGAINAGCSKSAATAITNGPSVYSHAMYSLAALSLDWVIQGGLDSLQPAKITNDFHDLDYVVTATYCRSLETEDERANRVYSALRAGFEKRPEKFRAVAGQQATPG